MGERIIVTGRVFDGSRRRRSRMRSSKSGRRMRKGLYNSPAESAARPIRTSPVGAAAGRCRGPAIHVFETIKPGRVPYQDGRPMAPHITFWIVSRGINIGLHTRMYFGDEEAANAE